MMLKIKEGKWNEFQEKSNEYGFQLNDSKNAFVKKFHQDEEHPKDYLELQIWFSNQQITIETSNDRYSGISTDGAELIVLYDLIMNGFVEKTIK